MYGLIEGGPEIDVAWCDRTLARGKAIGFLPFRVEVLLIVRRIRGPLLLSDKRIGVRNAAIDLLAYLFGECTEFLSDLHAPRLRLAV